MLSVICFSDAPLESPLQLLTYRKAHPKRHLACAIISSFLFFVTGKWHSLTRFILMKMTPVVCSLGIVAVYYAVKSLQCQNHGYFEQALIHSRRSLSWSLATYVIALFIYLTLGLLVFIHTLDHHWMLCKIDARVSRFPLRKSSLSFFLSTLFKSTSNQTNQL